MRQKSSLILTAILWATLLGLVASPSSAQRPYTFSLGVMGGFAGSIDDDPDAGIGNTSLQGLFSMELEPRTYFTVRVGTADFQVDEFGGLFDSTLRYVTLGGEYRFPSGFYESGLYFAVGGYDLDGEFAIQDETSFGVAVGATGDFRLSDRLSILVEFSGHYADLDYTQIFAMGHVGLAFHF